MPKHRDDYTKTAFSLTVPIQIVRPAKSIAETQPQLHPALLRLSAMISQYFKEARILPCLFSPRQRENDIKQP